MTREKNHYRIPEVDNYFYYYLRENGIKLTRSEFNALESIVDSSVQTQDEKTQQVNYQQHGSL